MLLVKKRNELVEHKKGERKKKLNRQSSGSNAQIFSRSLKCLHLKRLTNVSIAADRLLNASNNERNNNNRKHREKHTKKMKEKKNCTERIKEKIMKESMKRNADRS